MGKLLELAIGTQPVRGRTVAVALLWLAGSVGFAGTRAEAVGLQEQHLYRTLMLRAAPGELASLIEALQARMPVWQEASAVGPFLMRHSQGDQWDLLLLFHLGRGYNQFYSAAARDARRAADLGSGESEVELWLRLLPKIAWREELDVWGPEPEIVADRFEGAGFFHVEIFLALAGQRGELVRQREMENVYLAGIGREPNLIFTRAGGAPWDCYTIGFYRDIKHYAESADIPEPVREQAAVAAGFESSSRIGTYLRELIASHHDTLAVAVR